MGVLEVFHTSEAFYRDYRRIQGVSVFSCELQRASEVFPNASGRFRRSQAIQRPSEKFKEVISRGFRETSEGCRELYRLSCKLQGVSKMFQGVSGRFRGLQRLSAELQEFTWALGFKARRNERISEKVTGGGFRGVPVNLRGVSEGI